MVLFRSKNTDHNQNQDLSEVTDEWDKVPSAGVSWLDSFEESVDGDKARPTSSEEFVDGDKAQPTTSEESSEEFVDGAKARPATSVKSVEDFVDGDRAQPTISEEFPEEFVNGGKARPATSEESFEDEEFVNGDNARPTTSEESSEEFVVGDKARPATSEESSDEFVDGALRARPTISEYSFEDEEFVNGDKVRPTTSEESSEEFLDGAKARPATSEESAEDFVDGDRARPTTFEESSGEFDGVKAPPTTSEEFVNWDKARPTSSGESSEEVESSTTPDYTTEEREEFICYEYSSAEYKDCIFTDYTTEEGEMVPPSAGHTDDCVDKVLLWAEEYIEKGKDTDGKKIILSRTEEYIEEENNADIFRDPKRIEELLSDGPKVYQSPFSTVDLLREGIEEMDKAILAALYSEEEEEAQSAATEPTEEGVKVTPAAEESNEKGKKIPPLSQLCSQVFPASIQVPPENFTCKVEEAPPAVEASIEEGEKVPPAAEEYNDEEKKYREFKIFNNWILDEDTDWSTTYLTEKGWEASNTSILTEELKCSLLSGATAANTEISPSVVNHLTEMFSAKEEVSPHENVESVLPSAHNISVNPSNKENIEKVDKTHTTVGDFTKNEDRAHASYLSDVNGNLGYVRHEETRSACPDHVEASEEIFQ